MEDRLYLMRSDRLVLGTETWLVLQNTGEYSIIIKLKTNKLELMRLRTEEIVYKIVRKEALLELNKITSNKLLDSETLPPNQQVNYNKAKEICGFLSSYSINLDWLLYRPERAEVIKMIVDKYQVSDDTVRRYILHYFQGGMNATALLPKYNNCGKVDKRIYTDKKPGKKGISIMPRDEKMEKIFSIMTSRYMASGAKISLTKLYDEMIGEFYSVKNQSYIEQFPVSLRPTIKQLREWIKTEIDKVKRETVRQGKKDARNNIRPTFSDTIAYLDVKTIGSRYEMDEVETDFCLVNRVDRTHPIGRAIVYFIVDIFSHSIVACGIGLDNNSWSGAELALLNMVENKKEFCSRYEIEIDENKWPMKYVLPSSILVDNGAEYLSNNFMEMAREAGISIDFAPPRMGSYKPNVEQKFKQMNDLLKNVIPGEIEKDKYGQPHLRKACLDIIQFSRAVISFIIDYNNSPMNKYPKNKEMFENHITPTPVNIWNYCLGKYNELSYVNDIESFKYSLYERDTASISRTGIEFENKFYICKDMEWLKKEASEASIKKHKKKTLNIRYDKRFPDVIYYEKDNERHMAFNNCPEVINQLSYNFSVNVKTSNSLYAGLTEFEIQDIINTKKQEKVENEEIRLRNRINTLNQLCSIKKEALDMHKGANETQGIDMNRSEEQQNLHNEQHIVVDEDKIIQEYDELRSYDKIEDKTDYRSMTRIEKFKWKEQQRVSNFSSDM